MDTLRRRFNFGGSLFGLTVTLSLTLTLVGLATPAHAVTVDELQQILREPAAVTVIDIRRSVAYRAGHIPGAINMPARSIPRKQMPPIGRVVVVGDGVNVAVTQAAATALSAKAGIQADPLTGGMPAWEALNRPRTGAAGVQRARIPEISYQKLQNLVQTVPALLLVDLRPPSRDNTPLSEVFPDVPRIEGALLQRNAVRAILAQDDGRSGRLLVLIDGGDGRAVQIGLRLRGAGVRRLVALTGGELSLDTRGRAEIMRKVSTR